MERRLIPLTTLLQGGILHWIPKRHQDQVYIVLVLMHVIIARTDLTLQQLWVVTTIELQIEQLLLPVFGDDLTILNAMMLISQHLMMDDVPQMVHVY